MLFYKWYEEYHDDHKWNAASVYTRAYQIYMITIMIKSMIIDTIIYTEMDMNHRLELYLDGYELHI